MFKFYPIAVITGLFAASSAFAAERLVVTASQSLDIARPAEVLVIPFSEVRQALGKEARPDHVVVRDAKGEILPSQVLNFNPDSEPGKEQLLFQHDFSAGEKSATFTIEKTEQPVPPFPSKVFARYVPERFDDFAWENDKMAHRAYGPALMVPSAGGDRMVSSGLDFWCKRVDYPIVDRWYLRSKGEYHRDSGEGLDMYDVNSARGCGGTGVWSNDRLYPSSNYTSWKVLANGPIRAIFELSYPLWDASGFQLSEVKRFTVDAGKSLDLIESTYTFASHAAFGDKTLSVAAGLARHKTNGAVTKNEGERWLSYWEDYGKHGQLGTAVVLAPDQDVRFAEDTLNHLAITTLHENKKLVYYAGGGWSERGEFKTKEAWNAYLSAFAAGLKSPVTLAYSSK
ncbi:MAG TPA: DUF4861 family protein [Opitutaceae bacterium]|nr:DUF4861 family protein [Opitutaceae bacterium]